MSAFTRPLEHGEYVTRESVEIRRIMPVLHEAMKIEGRHVQECELKGLVLKIRELVEWKCVLFLVLYC